MYAVTHHPDHGDETPQPAAHGEINMTGTAGMQINVEITADGRVGGLTEFGQIPERELTLRISALTETTHTVELVESGRVIWHGGGDNVEDGLIGAITHIVQGDDPNWPPHPDA
jgi:hypothetical protein